MIHNLYTETVGSIKAPENFKSLLAEKIQSKAVSALPIFEKKRHTPKLRTLAFVSCACVAAVGVFVCAFAVFGGRLTNYNKGAVKIPEVSSAAKNISGNTVNSAANNENLGGSAAVLPPHFKVNNRVYWTYTNEVTKLPPSFKPIGKIKSSGSANGNGRDLANFQSSFGQIGSMVYMDPSNPSAAYLGIVSSKQISENVYVPTAAYALYVTQELRSGSIYYNGGLYNYYCCSDDILNDLKCVVGTVKSVDYTRLPSCNFASNVYKSLGCRIYASKSHDDILYIELETSNYICLKLNWH